MTINQNMIAIVHSYPTSVSSCNNLAQVIPASVLIPIHQLSTEQAIQKDGMSHWWYNIRPLTAGGTLFTRSVSETLTLTETTILRKVIPKIAETLVLAESVNRKLTLVCTWIRAAFTYG